MLNKSKITKLLPHKTSYYMVCSSIVLIFQKVKFLGKEPQDEGRPKHEFWRLLAGEIKAQMCVGGEDRIMLEHDVLGLQVRRYVIHTCI